MPRTLLIAALLAALFQACLAGCASSRRGDATPNPAPESISAALAARARTVSIFRGTDGAPVSWEALVASAAGADAVMIGENHGHPLGLAFAAEVWADILESRPGTNVERGPVLSMEFFNRDEQSRLDDYLTGLWDEAALLKATGRTNPSAYPAGHRAMIESAKAAGRPVIAANAPRTYVRAASRESYERLAGLTEDQRRMFRIPDELPTGKYRDDFDAIMWEMSRSSRGGAPEQPIPDDFRRRLDSSFRAQSLWDWTMAESVARAIDQRGVPVVHVVGRFHSDFAGGLIQALHRLRPHTAVLNISVVNARSDTLRPEDAGRGDFVVYVGKSGEE
ncbi:MAG: ChaN family lipoprotein [Phycisphaeraceae bacterium]|nr:ChaN family lipoprotein [Phycisphaeraceae bacterium]